MGIFEKEDPEFKVEFEPTPEIGRVKAVISFSHAKLKELDVKVWIKDLGANFMADGLKNTISEWQLQAADMPVTFELKALRDLHFYSIGVDYRNPRSLTATVKSRVIKEGYRYQAPAPVAAAPVADATPEKSPAAPPCVPPTLRVNFEPEGYCTSRDRPAVVIQCLNCQDREWSFSTEISTPSEGWRPLRPDGQRQVAYGLSPRTEPLCILGPGIYKLRVLAWSKDCTDPSIHELDMPAIIPEQIEKLTARAIPESNGETAPQAKLPDTLIVNGQASLREDIISGTLELAPNPPFGNFVPYARISYVHPGYRDITIDNMLLKPGQQVPFSIHLDAEDLKRGVHPVHVVVFINSGSARGEIPVASLWIQTIMENAPAAGPSTVANMTAKTPLVMPPPPAAKAPPAGSSVQVTPPATVLAASTTDCGQIQNLQLFQNPESPDQSVLISWVNPDCCQEQDCNYTIWAGRNPNELRLMIDKQQTAGTSRELLNGLKADEKYFEVIVNTVGGIRKAACVRGFGPVYETAVADAPREPTPAAAPAFTSGELAVRGSTPASFSWNEEPAVASEASPITVIETPVPAPAAKQAKLPLSKFEACHYERAMTIENDHLFQPGESITINYDHSRPGYRYTLYWQPATDAEWMIAPGTDELQPSSSFTMQATPSHAGNYLILAYKPEKDWGCLSSAPGKAASIRVAGN